MSRTLAFGPKLTTGRGAVGLRSVVAARRASSRIRSIAGLGRVASIRSRMVFSSSMTRAAASRLEPSSSIARLYSINAPSS
jgi:hypothetical protein